MTAANPIDRHVGMRLRLRRIGLGLSAKQLAAKADLLEEEILRFEAGRERVDAVRLQRLARATQTPVTYFFEPPIMFDELVGGVELEIVNRRRHVRVKTHKDGVATVGGAMRRVQMLDISRGGAKLTNLAVEDIGKIVEFFIAGGHQIGTVVWAQSNIGGVRFNSLIPSEAAAELGVN